VVFLRKHVTKHDLESSYPVRTFQGDVWQEAQALLGAEERRELFDDASAIAQAERSRMRLADGLMNSRTPVVVSCIGGAIVAGSICEVGKDVVVVQENDTTCAAFRLQSVLRIEGVVNALRVEVPAASSAVPLTMNGWLRSHSHVAMHCLMIDGWVIRGKVQEVGEDFITLRCEDDRVISLMTQHISVIRSIEVAA
jgi:hypothetical protein